MSIASEFRLEARGTENAIAFWNQKAEQFGRPPPLAEFGPIDFVGQPFRFILGADLLVNADSVFLAYGSGLAKLLGLPERPSMHVPMIECIPNRYRFLFLEGCSEAGTNAEPVRFSGELAGLGGSELYRACFMPLKMQIKTYLAVYGSFNFRFCTTAELGERHQTAKAGGSRTFSELPVSAVKSK